MAIATFSGLASGIDSASLIDAIIESRESANAVRRREIESLQSENSALDEFNTKLIALNDLIDQFRTLNGGGIRKKASSSTSTVATAAASSSAANGVYGLTVNSIASTATGSLYTAGGYSSTSAVFQSGSGSGSLQIDVGQGSDLVSINVNVTLGSTTLQDVVDAINNDSNASGRVVATAVNTGTSASPNYQVVLTTQQEGEDKGLLAITPTGLASVSVSTIDQATDAEFSISGINGTITRSSNTVSDVIPGLTFQLITNGTTNISVGSDADSTADLVNEIVVAYNDLVEFINDNDEIERVEDGNDITNIYGSLAKASVDNEFLTQFRTMLSNANSANGTIVQSMAELGISTNRDGTLTFDIEKFKTVIGQDPTGVSEVLTDFADQTAGVEGFIYQFTRFNGFISLSKQSNERQIETLNSAIAQLERQTTSYRENLQGQFARLESLIARLQSQQQQMVGILASL